MQGSSEIRFTRHSESYVVNLPSLRFPDPLSEQGPVELWGKCSVRCGTTGMKATLNLGDDRSVKGTVSQLNGAEDVTIANISGNWDGQVSVETLEQAASGAPRHTSTCRVDGLHCSCCI